MCEIFPSLVMHAIVQNFEPFLVLKEYFGPFLFQMDQILDLLPGSTCNFQLFSWRYVQMFENFPGHACNSPKFWTFLVLKGYFGPILIQMDQILDLFLGSTCNFLLFSQPYVQMPEIFSA